MSLCPFVRMPEYFTYLLQANMQSTGQLYRELPIYFAENASLRSLIDSSLKDIDKEVRIDFFLKSLGWHGLRDRIASLFIYQSIHGDYPDSPMLALVDEVLEFEVKIKKYTIGSYSRGFLLGMYLKLSEIQRSKSSAPGVKSVVEVDREIFQLLEAADSKVIKIDFMIIVLIYLKKFLGYKIVRSHLSSSDNYEKLYDLLSVKQRAELIGNLLAYGSSIGDEEIFINRIV